MFMVKTTPRENPASRLGMGSSMQYFVNHTALAIVREGNQFASFAHPGVRKIFETLCITSYAPMVSFLFVCGAYACHTAYTERERQVRNASA